MKNKRNVWTSGQWPAVWFFTMLFTGLSCMSENAEVGNSASLKLPKLFEEGHLYAMVETPVGSNYQYSFNHQNHSIDTVESQAGPMDYLPYPANFGFFPLLEDDSLKKIPVWILGVRQPLGSTMAINLLGVIDYIDRGVPHREWLAIPENLEFQTIKSRSFRDFIILHDPVKFMFEYWLKNRHGIGAVSQIMWHDEDKALEYLEEVINK